MLPCHTDALQPQLDGSAAAGGSGGDDSAGNGDGGRNLKRPRNEEEDDEDGDSAGTGGEDGDSGGESPTGAASAGNARYNQPLIRSARNRESWASWHCALTRSPLFPPRFCPVFGREISGR